MRNCEHYSHQGLTHVDMWHRLHQQKFSCLCNPWRSFNVDKRNMRPNSPKWIQIHGSLSYSLWIVNHKWLMRVTLVLLRLFTMSTHVYATKSQLKVASVQLLLVASTTSFTIQTPSLWSCWLNFCHLKQRNKQRYIHRKRFLKQQVPGMKTQNPGN